ncbi:MAG TPA: type II CAAX endopeptidase family protein [Terriglobales bacterium]|nr:type II CAAX endopeptidase family protein [Terriglobales bacterium]
MHEARPDREAKLVQDDRESPSLLPASSSTSRQPTHPIFLGQDGLRPGWRIFLYLGMGIFLYLILSSLEPLISAQGAGWLWRSMFLQAVLVLSGLLPAYVMATIEQCPFASYGFPLRKVGAWFGLGVLWGILALSALMLLLWLMGVFSFGGLSLHGPRILRFALFWGVFFLLVAVFEEFAFRGYSQFTLAQGIGFWPAACVLSLVFGGLHLWLNEGESGVGALCAAGIGLFFCFTLRRTGSLWFALGMHASWDWGESYFYSVPDSGGTIAGHLLNSSFHGAGWLTGGTVGPEGSVLAFVVIAASWVMFDRIYPGEKRSHGGPGASSKNASRSPRELE